MKNKPRVRFAPAPTGLMHLGNIRTALMNYLFSHQKGGTFVLRIEDTDPQRNIDPGGKKIIADLQWLGLDYDEGPIKGGPYKPYFQSERTNLYQEKLQELEKKDLVYRCFCSCEELEKKRQQQIALKLPPRYDRTCMSLSEEKIKEKLKKNIPFIWRMKIDTSKIIEVTDLARGTIKFDLAHFSDFPITRQDGSFTFIFANGIDDALMKITHVLRGEDHLTNTANQAILYKSLGFPLPTFWHLPILCNAEGKKLSKRDFGFSLQDLKNGGFLPEAICNYLAIIGGGTFKQEIMSLDELVNALNFDDIHSTGHIRYDVEKLRWVNHKWIDRYDPEKLTQLARPYLEKQFPQANKVDDTKLTQLLQAIKTDLTTLQDIPKVLSFYFEKPEITKETITQHITEQLQSLISSIIRENLNLINDPDTFIENMKQAAKKENISLQAIFSAIRLALIGKPKGPSTHDILHMLDTQESKKRIEALLQIISNRNN